MTTLVGTIDRTKEICFGVYDEDGNGDVDDVVVDDANDSGDDEEGTKDSDDEMVIGTEC